MNNKAKQIIATTLLISVVGTAIGTDGIPSPDQVRDLARLSMVNRQTRQDLNPRNNTPPSGLTLVIAYLCPEPNLSLDGRPGTIPVFAPGQTWPTGPVWDGDGMPVKTRLALSTELSAKVREMNGMTHTFEHPNSDRAGIYLIQRMSHKIKCLIMGRPIPNGAGVSFYIVYRLNQYFGEFIAPRGNLVPVIRFPDCSEFYCVITDEQFQSVLVPNPDQTSGKGLIFDASKPAQLLQFINQVRSSLQLPTPVEWGDVGVGNDMVVASFNSCGFTVVVTSQGSVEIKKRNNKN